MKRVPSGAVLLLLVLLPGCDRVLTPSTHSVYSAWEEGLTLGYETPGSHQRLSVRVKEAKPSAAGLAVTETYSTTTGFSEAHLLLQDGGVVLEPDSASRIPLLPEGFPDRVARWETRGSYHWVVGRATVDLPGVHFPDPSAAVGIWVESFSLAGPGRRTRTLYLPDIGEGETQAWDPQTGRWVTSNRLVTRGFSDVPRIGAAAAVKTNGSHA